MAKITIPKNAGQFKVIIAPNAGNWLVVGSTGITIACISRSQADEICCKLNKGDHNGQINVPDRVKRR